jgi:hypothetical protein
MAVLASLVALDSTSLYRYAAIITPALFLSLLFFLLAVSLLLRLWLSLGGSTLCRLLLGSFRALKVTKKVKRSC